MMLTNTKDHGLTPHHEKIIKDILKHFAFKIDQVCLFGSRATGHYRDNSDIDMVIYGTITEKDIDVLRTSFDESSLPLKVDLVAYHLITYDPFKKHIDDVMKPLFSKDDLI
jgi:predicted nucleotidyltransferase